MKALSRIYRNAWGYLLIWAAVGLLVDCVMFGGLPSWSDLHKLNTIGIIFFYAGVVALVAPHTRKLYSAHNWYLSLTFWLISNRVLSNTQRETPVYAGEDYAWFCAALFGIWLLYLKAETKGILPVKERQVKNENT